METTLTITDVTRMSAPRVCVAGITDDGRSIRPVLPFPGIQEDWLYEGDYATVRPFARVKLNLLRPNPQPPHTEDWFIDQTLKENRGFLLDDEKFPFLWKISFPSVASIFETEIQNDFGHYVREGNGKRSLGTIVPGHISFVNYDLNMNDRWETHITFSDWEDREYRLAVTDLSFQYYVNHLREKRGQSNRYIGLNLQKTFSSRETFLRIGLTRPTWEKHPHCCSLQITGVYTFPDYLEGRCFADYLPQQEHDEIELN